MKKVKRIVVFVILMMFVLSFCGCQITEKNQIIGTWRTQLNCSDILMQSIAERDSVLAQYYDIRSFIFTLDYTFNEDGTYSISTDTEEFQKSIEATADEIYDGMKRYYDEDCAKNSTTTDALFASMGTTFDAFMNALIEGMELENYGSLFDINGNYKVNEGKLYLSDGLEYQIDITYYDEYIIEGDTLTLTKSYAPESDDEAELANSFYPIELKRIVTEEE